MTLVGSLLWDRLCVALFAPRIFAAQLHELRSLSLADFWGPNSPRYVGGAALAGAWLYLTEGNLVLAGIAYFAYKKLIKEPQEQAAAAQAERAAKEQQAAARQPKAKFKAAD